MEQELVFQANMVLNPTVNLLYSSLSTSVCVKCSQWSIMQTIIDSHSRLDHYEHAEMTADLMAVIYCVIV